ncbi:septum site-determining protein MinD [bacterium]|nr:septum site-determining protein MinD [bacterium]MBR1619617.1 septum site-determining protein MinD [bacterium]
MTGRVIVITSGKGGVGKTTTNANIGTALARAGKKVVMVDTDLGLRNLDLLLGLENRIVYTIVDVVEERCKLKQALVKDKKNPNLCLLAAAQTRDKSAVTEEQLKDICDQLKEQFDFVLVDCPAGIEQGFQNAVAGASEAIVVTTPEMSAVRDADRIIGLLEAKEEIKSYKLLINRYRPNMAASKDMMSKDDVVEILSAELIGIIPEDTGIITSTNKGEPIVNDDDSLAGRAYRNVAQRIIGEDVPIIDFEEEAKLSNKIKKFFSKFLNKGKEN